jgi:hypothetical protein
MAWSFRAWAMTSPGPAPRLGPRGRRWREFNVS